MTRSNGHKGWRQRLGTLRADLQAGMQGGLHAGLRQRAHSLRWRLWAATWVLTGIALLLAGTVLSGLFREQVMRQFEQQLVVQLDQLTALVQPDAQGRVVLDAQRMLDPRWQRPFSGLYWQIESGGGVAGGPPLRSRSLWDVKLQAPADRLVPGQLHAHPVAGPAQQSLWLVERMVQIEAEGADRPAALWRLMVAADLAETQQAQQDFSRVLLGSLGSLWLLLSLAAWAQLRVGLSPLQALQQAVQGLRKGERERLQGRFPSEVQPLVDDFNAVLALQDQTVQRARTSAGNLAHALKTPLTVLAQAAQQAQGALVPAALVQEQVQRAQRHLDWHLSRARRMPVGRPLARASEVAPAVAGLVRVLQRVHAGRGLDLQVALAPALRFAGETEDLHEILGNLLDNACKWACSRVRLTGQVRPADPSGALAWLQLYIDDDGPGIDEAALGQVLQRGVRLDESTPGSGLGLSIVDEAVRAHGGRFSLGRSPWGGLRVELELPAA